MIGDPIHFPIIYAAVPMDIISPILSLSIPSSFNTGDATVRLDLDQLTKSMIIHAYKNKILYKPQTD